jgi:branched-chain amino acid transport system permease protein
MAYTSAGILSFAFAALAYFIARPYYFLHIPHKWEIPEVAIMSIVVVAPLLMEVAFRGMAGSAGRRRWVLVCCAGRATLNC